MEATDHRIDWDGETVHLPAAMLAAVIADAEAAGFVNEGAAESLRYELRHADGSDADAIVDPAEWVTFLATEAGL